MSVPSSIATIGHFVQSITDGEPPTMEALACSLDALALAYHYLPKGEPAGEADPPKVDYPALCRSLKARFPDLGCYSSADHCEDLESEPLVGDAIDDLADIVRDLNQILWRFDRFGADDAHWYLRFMFRAHWGRHLRHLSLYLHAKQFG